MKMKPDGIRPHFNCPFCDQWWYDNPLGRNLFLTHLVTAHYEVKG